MNITDILRDHGVDIGTSDILGERLVDSSVGMPKLSQEVQDKINNAATSVVIAPIAFDEFPNVYPIGFSMFDVPPTHNYGEWLSVFGISQIDSTPYTKLRIYTDRTSDYNVTQRLVVVDDNSKLKYISERTSIGSQNQAFEAASIVYGIPSIEVVNDFTTGGATKAASAETVKILKTELDSVVPAPAYGVEVFNENHAIRRFPAFNGWQNSTLPELMYAIFDTTLENVEGEFRIRASTVRDANGGAGTAECQTTVRSTSSTVLTNQDYAVFKASEEFAKQFYCGSGIVAASAEPANGRPAFSFVKILKPKPLYVEIEMFTSNGKAKEVLESIFFQIRPNAYTQPWTLLPQKSSLEKARYALMEGYTSVTVTVSPSGNDMTGKWNDNTLPFKTIQAAIDSLPRYNNLSMNVSIQAGTYAEIVVVRGFTGSSTLTIRGGASVSEANNFKVQGLQISGCSMMVEVSGLHFNNAGSQGVSVRQSQYVIVSYCNLDAGTSMQPGISTEASTAHITSCNISNRYYGIIAHYGSSVYTTANTGSGNTIGLTANTASTIGKHGTQAGATTAEVAQLGGQIR